MTSHRPAGHAGVERARDEHLPALSRFFARVWDPDSTPAKVARAREAGAASNPVEPGRVPPAFVFLRDQEVIGYLSTIPARFRVGDGEQGGYWLKGLWVLPEHRGGPVGFHLVRFAAGELGTLASLAVAEPARRLFEAVGFQDVARPPNYLWPLRAGRLAQRLDPDRTPFSGSKSAPRLWKLAQLTRAAGPAGALGGLLLRLRRSRIPGGSEGPEIVTNWDDLDDTQADQLWNRVAAAGVHGLVRDAAYLRWRYGTGRSDYQPVFVSQAGRIEAIAVIRHPTLQTDGPLAGIRLSWLSELLFDPARDASRRAARIAVRRSEREARRLGADLLASSFSGPGMDDVLRGEGHFRRAPSMHLLVRGLDEESTGEPWLVARGDGNSDGA